MRIWIVLISMFLVSCAAKNPGTEFHDSATGRPIDQHLDLLINLPAPDKQISVAVYSFSDLTGQRKPNDNYADLSYAVSQAGNDMLIGILLKAARGQWFKVAERDELKAVVQEQTLKAGHGHKRNKLISADYLLTGGIIGYDSNFVTGGFGARYFGIGASTKYRSDLITIALRLVDTRTGEVILATEAHDTVMSYGFSGGGVRHIAGKFVELDAGITRNEVLTIITRRAISKSLLQLMEEAVDRKIWKLDPDSEAMLRVAISQM